MTSLAEPILYGQGTLSDVMPSAASVLGVPGYHNVLGVPETTTVCVLLVDGLGWNVLRRRQADAPFLARLSTVGTSIAAGFPSTTATSLTSLGTGLSPARHGVLGYRVLVPHLRRVMSSLAWDPDVDPLSWQPHSPVFERATAHRVPAHHVAPGAFRESGLTRVALRGAQYVPSETSGDLVANTIAAAAGGGLVLTYHSELDRTGHLRGCRSQAWRHQLALVDRLVERLASGLDPQTVLIVTGDHGMIDIPEDRRIDYDTHPDLSSGVEFLAGEPRVRHIYAESGAAGDVQDTWLGVLGPDAWVLSREQAVDEGWFGPDMPEHHRGRIGDVIAAMSSDAVVVTPSLEPVESTLVGQHGSLTADEQLVPFLMARGGEPVGHGT